MSNFTKAAFQAAIDSNRRETLNKTYYVTLWREVQWYGGPEEGGWWGSDHIPLETARYSIKEDAENAAKKVEELADILSKESTRAFGEKCLKELEWLDNRNFDADYLSEPDGEDQFFVSVEDEAPRAMYGERGYS
jgi:hypothetical protein